MTETVSPDGLPAGPGSRWRGRCARTGGEHGGQGEQAEGEGQAFHGRDSLGCRVVAWWSVRRRPQRCRGEDEAREGGQLAPDDRDGAPVVAGEIDGEQDDQGDFDALGDVGGAEVRAHGSAQSDDGRGGIADEAEPDDPAEADRQGERDDHRDRGDGIAGRRSA